MDILDIFKLITLILGVISTSIIPLIFELKKAMTKFKNANTDAEKQKAIVDMFNVARSLIEVAEQTLAGATGKDKKENVLNGLEQYATEHNYSYDKEYWSNEVDNLVAMTNVVNVNK